MKYLKTIGLVGIAATAFIAVAGSASADVLCKAAPNKSGECSTASGDYAAGTTFKGNSTNLKLTLDSAIFPYITCKESNIELKNTATGSNTPGAAVAVEITDLTFTNDCTTPGGLSCTFSTTKGYTGTVKALNDSGTGDLVVFGNTIRTKVVCPGVLSCEYSPKPSGLGLHISGGNPATITASVEALDQSSGFGCGYEAKLDADYILTSPTALWVATKMD